MKKTFYFLVIIGSQVVLGGKDEIRSLGTQLFSLRESRETDFSTLLKQKDVRCSYLSAETPSYSSLAAKKAFDLLHSSEEYQVVAAWLQVQWLQEDKVAFARVECSDRWKDRGERVKNFVRLLARASLYENGLSDMYKACYKKTEPKDRFVPGCGNRPVALLRPERFAERMASCVSESMS